VPDTKKKKIKEVSAVEAFSRNMGADFTRDTFDPNNPFGD